MSQITLKQIAERAGTSVGTVDRALNNRGRISPSTKEKIIKIADEMGYQPNKIASALSRSKRLRIAVIYAKYPAYFVDEFTAGLNILPITRSKSLHTGAMPWIPSPRSK